VKEIAPSFQAQSGGQSIVTEEKLVRVDLVLLK
jgi:hypothetical protein